MSPSPPDMLSWEEIEPAAKSTFTHWTARSDLEWARVAWGHLAQAGLTTHSTGLELTRAGLRFLTLVGLYSEWLKIGDKLPAEPAYLTGAHRLNLHPFHLGQLIGEQEGYDWTEDPAAEFEVLEELANRFHDEVVAALIAGFGNEVDLCVALLASELDLKNGRLNIGRASVAKNEGTGQSTNELAWVQQGCRG